MDTKKPWRPKNWVAISNKAVSELKKEGMIYTPACFLAGGDAMLEAVKEDGIKLDKQGNPVKKSVSNLIHFLDGCANGTLVFIPDNQEKTGW